MKNRMTKEDVQAIRKKSDDIQQFCIDEEKTNLSCKYLYHHLPMKDPEKYFLDADNWDLTKEERAFIEKGLKELETYHRAFLHDELAEDADVLPPWIAFPLYPLGTMGWRMGTGETYKAKWNEYMGSLTEEERSAYNRRFPMPLYMIPIIT